MTEPGPVSFSLLASAIALLGPQLGPYALIVFAACVGSALALSREPSSTRWAGIRFVVVGALVALTVTGPLVWAAQNYLDIPANIALVPVAFILGAARNGLLLLIDKALDAIPAAFSALTSAGNRRDGP